MDLRILAVVVRSGARMGMENGKLKLSVSMERVGNGELGRSAPPLPQSMNDVQMNFYC